MLWSKNKSQRCYKLKGDKKPLEKGREGENVIQYDISYMEID